MSDYTVQSNKAKRTGTVENIKCGIGDKKHIGLQQGDWMTAMEDVEMTCSGRLFQTQAMATGKV